MSQENNFPILIRRACEEDVNFIFNSWLKSYRNSLFARNMHNTIYFDQHHKVVERLLKTSEVLIACDQKDPSSCYGYIVAEKVDNIFVLHFTYVKHPFRKFGVATALLNAFDHNLSQASIYTHHTRVAELLAPKYNMVYNPYVALCHQESKDEE